MCLISVIVPVYNSEKYVEKCIRSLQLQTLSDIEIIVINDGSSDRSPDIVKEMMKDDRRIRLLDQENQGVSVARNHGIEAAKGRFLTFVDGDDWLMEDYLACLYGCAVNYHAEIVIGGISMVDEDDRLIREICPNHYQRFRHEEWPMRISAAGAHLYKRSFWEDHRLRFVSGERGEDIPIALYCNAVCRNICVTDHPGYMYVQHQGSGMTGLKGLKQHSVPYKGLEAMICRLAEEGIANSRDFHELFVLRILATFLFQLGPGSDWGKMKVLCDYIIRILDTYYSEYGENPYIKIRSRLDFPFSQRVSVRLLVWLVRYRMLYLISGLLCLVR